MDIPYGDTMLAAVFFIIAFALLVRTVKKAPARILTPKNEEEVVVPTTSQEGKPVAPPNINKWHEKEGMVERLLLILVIIGFAGWKVQGGEYFQFVALAMLIVITLFFLYAPPKSSFFRWVMKIEIIVLLILGLSPSFRSWIESVGHPQIRAVATSTKNSSQKVVWRDDIIVNNPNEYTKIPNIPAGVRFNIYCEGGKMRVFWRGGPTEGLDKNCGEAIGENLRDLEIGVAPTYRNKPITVSVKLMY